MTGAQACRGFRFPAEVILWAVRWYLRFSLSCRNPEGMLADRGVAICCIARICHNMQRPFK